MLKDFVLLVCACCHWSIPDTVNAKGTNCPYALKMLACLVLEEITTFLRETFQYLPRKKHKLEPGWDKHLTSRRYSSIISSPGHSDRSSESNIGDLPQSSQGNVGDNCRERLLLIYSTGT